MPEFTYRNEKQAPLSYSEVDNNLQAVEDIYDNVVVAEGLLSTQANLYPDVATGLADTVNGDYFNVVSATLEGYTDLYLNDAGVATLQKSFKLPVNVADGIDYAPPGFGAVTTDVQTKLRETISVKDFDAKGDGTTDDTSALQSAINYIKTLGGGRVYIPEGVYLISSTLIIDSPNIELFGDKHDMNLFADVTKGTILKWNGGVSSGYMMQVYTVDSALSKKIGGVVVDGIAFNGNGQCARGLHIRTVDNSVFSNLGFEKLTEWGIYTETNLVAPNGGSTVEAADNQHNYFSNILVNCTGQSSCGGIKLTANPLGVAANTSMNEFHNLSVRIEDGVALHFGNADSNTVQHFRVFRVIADTGLAVKFDEQTSDPAPNVNYMYARTNVIYHMHTAWAGIEAVGTLGAFKPSVDNAIFGLNLDGNAVNVEPVIGSDATLSIFSARQMNVPLTNAIVSARSSYVNGNTNSGTAEAAKAALGLPNDAAMFIHNENANAAKHIVVSNDNGVAWELTIDRSTGNLSLDQLAGTSAKVVLGNSIQLQGQTTTTSATAGSASPLPGNPQGYLVLTLNGVDRKIAFWPV